MEESNKIEGGGGKVTSKPPKGWGARHTFILMAFLARLIEQGLRVNLSVAIVAMVKEGKNWICENLITFKCFCFRWIWGHPWNRVSIPWREFKQFGWCLFNELVQVKKDVFHFQTEASSDPGEFDWSAKEQGIVLGAFYYGFVISMLPGGYFSERYSGKWILLISFVGGTLCNFLSPMSARLGGSTGFIALKVIQGFLQVRKC